MNQKFAINVGRQLGSGGHEIGEKIASRLNIAFYDKELINVASEKSGLCLELFEKADEEASQGGMFSSLTNLHIPFITESSIPSASFLTKDSLFKIQSDVIRMLIAVKPCVFMGRCADYILRNNPSCVNIFITANPQDRIKRLCNLRNISKDEAISAIEKCDRRRAEYYNYYTTGKWGAADTYHICINSSVLGIDGTVDYLLSFIHQKIGL